MRLASVLVVAIALGAAAGCASELPCGPLPPVLESGTYVAPPPAPPSTAFPHGTATSAKSMEVDLAARTVVVRYERDGHGVVETWDIVSY